MDEAHTAPPLHGGVSFTALNSSASTLPMNTCNSSLCIMCLPWSRRSTAQKILPGTTFTTLTIGPPWICWPLSQCTSFPSWMRRAAFHRYNLRLSLSFTEIFSRDATLKKYASTLVRLYQTSSSFPDLPFLQDYLRSISYKIALLFSVSANVASVKFYLESTQTKMRHVIFSWTKARKWKKRKFLFSYSQDILPTFCLCLCPHSV